MKNIFQNKKVLITGHTGFKGSWLSLILKSMGAKLYGFSLPSIFKESLSNTDEFNELFDDQCLSDICSRKRVYEFIDKTKPDFIFHLAAQPIVIESFKDPVRTFNENIMGTAHVLEAANKLTSDCNILVVTTDKVYQNKGWSYPYRENDMLGGFDPYSASKACTEIIVNSFRNSFFKEKNITIGTVRGGNVIGGGDWSPYRIIPDYVRAAIQSNKLQIRNPSYTRPWQHVFDCLYGYIEVASYIKSNTNSAHFSFNIGPNPDSIVTVLELIKIFNSNWPLISKPQLIFPEKTLSGKNSKESKFLKLDCSLAKSIIGWKPILNLNNSVQMTSSWYLKFIEDKAGIFDYSKCSVEEYLNKL